MVPVVSDDSKQSSDTEDTITVTEIAQNGGLPLGANK
jgi:hypothetical protein